CFFHLFVLPLIIKPEFDGNFVPGGWRTKCVNTLDGPRRRLVQRRNAAGLFNADVAGGTVAFDVKGDVDAVWIDCRSNFHGVPIIRHLPFDYLDIPAITATEVSALKVEAALYLGRLKSAVGAADWAALAVRNSVVRRRDYGPVNVRRLCDCSLLLFALGFFFGNGNGLWLFLGLLGNRLGQAFGLVGDNVLGWLLPRG